MNYFKAKKFRAIFLILLVISIFAVEANSYSFDFLFKKKKEQSFLVKTKKCFLSVGIVGIGLVFLFLKSCFADKDFGSSSEGNQRQNASREKGQVGKMLQVLERSFVFGPSTSYVQKAKNERYLGREGGLYSSGREDTESSSVAVAVKRRPRNPYFRNRRRRRQRERRLLMRKERELKRRLREKERQEMLALKRKLNKRIREKEQQELLAGVFKSFEMNL